MGSVVTPVLRSFDECKAREFYCEFLGFSVLFHHRFEPDLPLYMSVGLGDVELHLSEHHGDSCPGAHIRIMIPNVSTYADTLAKQNHSFARPGPPDQKPGGTLELTLTDPFGNRLTFWQPEPEN